MDENNGSTSAPPRDGPGIDFGKSKILFNRKTTWGFGLVVLIIALGIIGMVWDLPSLLFGGLTTILGTTAGILLAPTAKPVDHSKTAHTSVERLLDLNTKVGRMRSEVTNSIQQAGDDGLLVLRLVGIQDSFVDQEELLHRSVTDWAEVSPGVVERVQSKRKNGLRIFEELAKENNHGR